MWTEEDVAQLEVTFQHMRGRTDENHKKYAR
jgi:hypothetical protein